MRGTMSFIAALAFVSGSTGTLATAAAQEVKALAVAKPVDVTPGLDQGDQRWPVVAYGQDCYLVVWQEGEAMDGVKDTNICAARVSADGKPLDPKAIPICRAKGFQAYPSVAFDGKTFVVVWQDYRAEKDWDLYAARVSVKGEVLDPDGFPVAAETGNQIYPTIAADGSGRCLVAWSDIRPHKDGRETYTLFGRFLTGGKDMGEMWKLHGEPGRDFLQPVAAHDGVGYCLLAKGGPVRWRDGFTVLLRVKSDGQVSVFSKEPVAWGSSYALAADPAGKQLLAWSNQRAEHGEYVTFYGLARFQDSQPAGTKIVCGLQPTFPPRSELWSAATFNGKSFIVVVEQVPVVPDMRGHSTLKYDLLATRVDPKTLHATELLALDAPAKYFDDPRVGNATLKKGAEEVQKRSLVGINLTKEEKLSSRHPALASAGNGRALLIYSLRGGVGKFRIHGVLLSE